MIMCVGETILLSGLGILALIMVLIMLYMHIVWTNGFDSKKRVFCIKKYDEKFSTYPYKVYWRFTWLPFVHWHSYITDAYYMDTAEFDTMQKAHEFINHEYDYMFNRKEETIEEVPYV